MLILHGLCVITAIMIWGWKKSWEKKDPEAKEATDWRTRERGIDINAMNHSVILFMICAKKKN